MQNTDPLPPPLSTVQFSFHSLYIYYKTDSQSLELTHKMEMRKMDNSPILPMFVQKGRDSHTGTPHAAEYGRLRQGIARLIDSYAEGTLDKAELDPCITRMRGRITQLEEQTQHVQDQAGMERELHVPRHPGTTGNLCGESER